VSIRSSPGEQSRRGGLDVLTRQLDDERAPRSNVYRPTRPKDPDQADDQGEHQQDAKFSTAPPARSII